MSIEDDQEIIREYYALAHYADQVSPIAAARGRLDHAYHAYISNPTDHNGRELRAARTGLRDLLAWDGA